MGSENSCDATSNKITLTININIQVPAFPVMEKRGFLYKNQKNSALALVDF